MLIKKALMSALASPWPVLCVLAVSLGLNVHLMTSRQTGTRIITEPTYKSGMTMPRLTATAINGVPAMLDWADPRDHRPSILYVFTPSCTWCTQNLENIRALSTSQQSRYRIIGLSLSDEGLTEYVSQAKLPFAVYSHATDERGNAPDLRVTPQTLLIAANGRIEKSWTGAYTGKVQGEIEGWFNIRLPGLIKSSPKH